MFADEALGYTLGMHLAGPHSLVDLSDKIRRFVNCSSVAFDFIVECFFYCVEKL